MVRYATEREIPVIRDVDVVVCGGGPGGIGAAVMAARMGAKTLLVERYGNLGGMAVHGEVHPFMSNHLNSSNDVRGDWGHGDICLDQPVYTDWLEQMATYQVEGGAGDSGMKNRGINKVACALAAEDLVFEAGAEILYHHTLADVILSEDGQTIETLIFLSKSGFVAVKAKQVIDTTGDADVAALAGCAFEMGDDDGNCQPMTLCFKLINVDLARVPDRELIHETYRAARAAGRIDCPRDTVLWFTYERDDVVHFNTTRVQGLNAANGEELSQAEIVARKQMREIVAFLKAEIPGFENAQWMSMGQHIGVRETRRVLGLNYIARDAFIEAKKYPDAIARVRYPVDIHSPTGGKTEILQMPPDEWYEIPYGCIVAKDCKNLLIGGRPISVDVAIHGSMRVMPPACSVGQAAGMAASMALKDNVSPHDLDGVKVREALIRQGAFLGAVTAATKS